MEGEEPRRGSGGGRSEADQSSRLHREDHLHAICGSDLHLLSGRIPTLEKGSILGHEFMGEVVETGPSVRKIKVGDRVVVPFTIACGQCMHCRRLQYSACDNTNPNWSLAEGVIGFPPAGMFGYAELTGGYAGGQAQYARVPHADTGLLKIESDLPDEKVLFLSDIFPTGYMAAENCDIVPGRSVVAVWGCGPVGSSRSGPRFCWGRPR